MLIDTTLYLSKNTRFLAFPIDHAVPVHTHSQFSKWPLLMSKIIGVFNVNNFLILFQNSNCE